MALIKDPGILCCNCRCNSKIFSFVLPEKCPSCYARLGNSDAFPFRLPYPFIRAVQHPCSVILRPTIGDFLNDYNNHMDLHIAVTTSKSVIVEFDRHGLRKHEPKDSNKSFWEQSLLVESLPEAWYEYWDETLTKICKQTCWTDKQYKKESYNCYTFVLSFLKALEYGELSKTASNRTLFCEKFIVPRTLIGGKYISLYRKIRDNGCYVQRKN